MTETKKKWQPRRQDPVPESVVREMPQAVEIEQDVLGAILIEPRVIDTVAEILKPEMFHLEKHEIVYEEILKMYNASMAVDLRTVTVSLQKSGKIDQVGGVLGVTELTNRVASSANVEYHARLIAEKYVQRELVRSSYETIEECMSGTGDAFDLISRSERSKDDLMNKIIVRKEISNHEAIKSTLDDLEETSDSPVGITGVRSGLVDLDKVTAGFQKTDLIILAARPGMGKSSFALTAAMNAAMRFGHPVAFFSLEMGYKQLVKKELAIHAGVPLERFFRKTLVNEDWITIHNHLNELLTAPVFLDDTPGISVTELRAKCRKMKRKHDIQLVVVDYLQLMTTGERNRNQNREQEISFISRSLKGLAKELDIPIIALSQLSRQVEARGNKRPMLSDLRESGAIEQDADMVIFLYRPEYYGQEEYEGMPSDGITEVIIAKHRNGALDDIIVQFEKSTTCFKDFNSNPGAFVPPPATQTLIPSTSFYETDNDDLPF